LSLSSSSFVRQESTSATELVEKGRIELEAAPVALLQKPRNTILGRVVGRSVCRRTLRYSFPHGARNLESRATGHGCLTALAVVKSTVRLQSVTRALYCLSDETERPRPCKSLRIRWRGFSNPPFRTRNSFKINYLEAYFWFRTTIVQRFNPP
jgi:hypothetical protein